ncbi:hypothetical protein [Nocardioides rubriscoriae]|uniref:hypothetical protein n=1 Tax=Nocardioides rubriscoriae TaxID=642762 RepID=UPI0011DF838B|nr:hypothetical protein [Nocardioides rubriscoriae]
MAVDWVARGIAIASTGTSLMALMWAITSWRLSGASIRVHCLAYRGVVVIRMFNAGRTSDSIEHVVLGGLRGGLGGVDLTSQMCLPVTLPPGQGQRWQLSSNAPPFADRAGSLRAGWDSLWVLRGSMRQTRVEVIPVDATEPPRVGWRLVPRRDNLSRYAPLIVGWPIVVVAGLPDVSLTVKSYLLLTTLAGLGIRAAWTAGSDRRFQRRRFERWMLVAALVCAFVETIIHVDADNTASPAAAHQAIQLAYLLAAVTLAVPGLASQLIAVGRRLRRRVRS